MLEVTFNIVTGEVTPIPDGPHQLRLSQTHRLTSDELATLRRLIISERLEIGIKTPALSTPAETRYVVDKLQHYVKEKQKHAPKWQHICYGWGVIVLMFAIPIFLAYHLSGWLENTVFSPLIDMLSGAHWLQIPWIQHILFGDYGILSLGTYSFVWALPVVVFISISTALLDHSGLKQFVIWSIEPSMRRIGLNGTDIVPVLEGFGCNASAVAEAGHQCSQCTQARCISLIGFGTSCSYQIGATLSIFNTAHVSWLFVPYLLLVFIGGVIHNRLWYRAQPTFNIAPTYRQASLRSPLTYAFMKQVIVSIRMFLTQALPIFLGICFAVSLLSLTTILDWLAKVFAPILQLLQLPTEFATGIFFSIIRKDGMLLFNTGHGTLIQSLSPLQLLMVVFLASTMTSCSVTMTMIARQLGGKLAGKLILKQMATSLGIVCALFGLLKLWDVLITLS
ncbi:ferrous iron transporter B [Staphylococcus hyicus]|uniref:nucleoside recognition domain-containing protein n=1 Tax=Staphylococcus hyicus TaxID=1284 RepID=UPI001F19A105|nr:nucleoside recognition domain-containing protein [Staphylococcus hyicus]MCE5154474.1 ferrous iron transporter B [Staphylococcus hyicus]